MNTTHTVVTARAHDLFEAAMRQRGYSDDQLRRNAEGRYESEPAISMWNGWQMACQDPHAVELRNTAAIPRFPVVTEEGLDTPLMHTHLDHVRRCSASDLQSARASLLSFILSEIERYRKLLNDESFDSPQPSLPSVNKENLDTPLMRAHLHHIRHCDASDLPSGRATFLGFLQSEVERYRKPLREVAYDNAQRELFEVITYAIAAQKKGLETRQIFATTPTESNGLLSRYIMCAIEHYRPDISNLPPYPSPSAGNGSMKSGQQSGKVVYLRPDQH
jgi:hypothetical protein